MCKCGMRAVMPPVALLTGAAIINIYATHTHTHIRPLTLCHTRTHKHTHTQPRTLSHHAPHAL